jgi:uncharacterized protein YjiS (DUF1127 family)
MRLENLNIGEISFDNQGHRGSPVAHDGSIHRVVAALALWRERAKQRAELARLDDISRRDLGITEADVWRETRKAPWEA